jgi:hypothetical protein
MTERIKAHGGFFAAAGAARAVISREHTHKEAVDARNKAWEAYCLVSLVGDDDTFTQARTLMRKISAMAFDDAPFNRSEWGELIAGFIEASRVELIPARSMES